MKWLTLIVLALLLAGCSSLNQQVVNVGKIDLANAVATRAIAKDGMATWRLNSGFIRQALGPTGFGQLPTALTDSMKQLDDLTLKYWTDYLAFKKIVGNEKVEFRAYLDTIDIDDFDLGGSLGTKVRMLLGIVQTALQSLAPQALQYAPVWLGL
jgi:hypothetical protein